MEDDEGQSGDTGNDWFESGEFVCVDKVPEKFRHIYSNYLCFNRIQSVVFNDIFETDASLVVSAPTGSGKTIVFELAITRLMRKYDLHQAEYNFMIIYVAPIKALCEERVLDWHKKFSSLGISCISVTGDSDIMSVQHLSNHNLIITTPEKWDSLTRRWRNSVGFINRVVLFMIDEVHLLNDESRGPTLEAIMSRMKTIEDSKEETVSTVFHQKIRFLAISATIPNVEDIAEWIGTRAMPAKYFHFSAEARPVKLMKIVQGYYYNPQMSTPFKFDIMLSYKLQGIILQYSNGKPTLIFCSTRKSVEMTSKHLSQNLTITLNGTQKSVLLEAASQITTPGIREILIHGVGSHHAGMLPDSRRIMETLFRNGDLPILVTTSTLAMGINLPAHLVIIKSTKYYTKGEYKDYSESVLLQMIGRAGRPQFDTFATAVILTTSSDKAKFENMIGGTQCIESSLHKHLTEHLNAEIVLRTITETRIAKQWLTSTFLHIRARKHPTYYGFSANLNQDQLDKKLMEMCQIEINKLERVGMIVIEDSNILPTEMGSLMAKFCVHFDTMKLFKEVRGTEILQQILTVISKCHEFSDLYLRVNDKKTLNLLNKCKNRETIRFPFSGKIKTLDMKINCIIQAVFGCLQILEPSLVNEAQKIMRIGERISKCLADYLETKEKCYSALLNALILAKCFHCRIWENSPYVSRQLAGIGAVMSSHLVQAGKTSFQSLLETNPRNLEMIIHRKPPMGDTLITAVEQLPHYTLKMEERKISCTAAKVKIVITLVNYKKLEHQLTIDSKSCMDLVVGDDSNNILLHTKYSHSFMIENREIEIEIPNQFNQKTTIKAHFISENWVGIDCTHTLELFAKPKAKSKSALKTPITTKVVKQPKKLEQVIESSDKPHVKNYINQYFKIVKKIVTPPQAQNSPIVENNVAPSIDFDENNLLGSDQDLSNWEPLDEHLLDSPDEREMSAAVDIIESETSNFPNQSNDLVIESETSNYQNQSNDLVIESGKSYNLNLEDTGMVRENATEKEPTVIHKNNNDTEIKIEEEFYNEFCDDFAQVESKNGEPNTSKPVKKFQFKKIDTCKDSLRRNVDCFHDEMVVGLKLNMDTTTVPVQQHQPSSVILKDAHSEQLLKDTRNIQNLTVTSHPIQQNQKQDGNQSPRNIQKLKVTTDSRNNQQLSITSHPAQEDGRQSPRNIQKPSVASHTLQYNQILDCNQSTWNMHDLSIQQNQDGSRNIQQLSMTSHPAQQDGRQSPRNIQKPSLASDPLQYIQKPDFNQSTWNMHNLTAQQNQEQDHNQCSRNIQQLSTTSHPAQQDGQQSPRNIQRSNVTTHPVEHNQKGGSNQSSWNNKKLSVTSQSALEDNHQSPQNIKKLSVPSHPVQYNQKLDWNQSTWNMYNLSARQNQKQDYNQSSGNIQQDSDQSQQNIKKLSVPSQPVQYNQKLDCNQSTRNMHNLSVQQNQKQRDESSQNIQQLPQQDIHQSPWNIQKVNAPSHSVQYNQKLDYNQPAWNMHNLTVQKNQKQDSTRNIQKLSSTSLSVQQKQKLDTRNTQNLTVTSHPVRDYGVNSRNTPTIDKSKDRPTQTKQINNPITPIIENLRGLITNKNSSCLADSELSSISETESEDPEESFSSARSTRSPRVDSFVNDVRNLSVPQHQKNTKLQNQDLNLDYAPPSNSRSSSAQGGEHYFNCAEDGRVVRTDSNRDLGMTSFSNLFTAPNFKGKPVVNNSCFERAILANSQKENLDIAKFTFTPKKRHPSTITSNLKLEADSTTAVGELRQKRMKASEFSYATQANGDKKSIKWRTPLIVSPKVKYSPKNFDRGIDEISQGSENRGRTELLAPPINMKLQANSRRAFNFQPSPNQILFAQSQGYQNPPSYSQRTQSARHPPPKRRHISPSPNFPLKTPKHVHKFPVTDQECGYSHSTQRVEDTQRRCNELNDFFCSSDVVFKPEPREMNFVESDGASYVRQNQPETVPAGHAEWWSQPAGQEWFNQPENNEDVKEEFQREINEMCANKDLQDDGPRFVRNQSFGSQCSCCNHCSNRNPFQNYNYQNIQEIYPQPAMYENCAPQRDFGNDYQMWDGPVVNPNQWAMVTQNHNPVHRGYDRECRRDLMQRYLYAQTQQTNFKEK